MSIRKEDVQVSDELANDKNWVAYQEALKTGEFEKMEPGTWVFYHQGQLAAVGKDKDDLFKGIKLLTNIDKKYKGGGFIHQVGVPEEIVTLPPYIKLA